MYRKVIITLGVILGLSGVAFGQLLGCGSDVPSAQVAFKGGEMLKYTVAYSAPLINAEVADIVFTTSNEHYMGRECYKVEGVGRTRDFYSLFFPLNDVYTSWLDAKTLRPIKATSNLREGSYHFRTALDFDYKALRVRTEGHNLGDNHTRRHNMDLVDCSYDALSLFYNMRSADLRELKVGSSQLLSLVLEDTVRSIRLRFIERGSQFISGIGRFNTLKFACQFATSDDQSFEDGAEFFLWLSDDENRIPIYLESPIRVGKVYARLSQWSGLKHSFSSFVVD